MEDPFNVEKYLGVLNKLVSAKNLQGRINELRKSFRENAWGNESKKVIEKIDEDFRSSMIQAEESVQVTNKKYSFSTYLKNQVQEIRFLRRCLRRISNHGELDAKILGTAKFFNVEITKDITKPAIVKKIAESRKVLKVLQAEHEELREKHLEVRSAKAAEAGNKTAEQIIKMIKNREKQARSWKK